MKLALITPTNNPEWLPQAYESIRDAACDWKWIILPNGNITVDDVPYTIRNDPRVIMVEAGPGFVTGNGIGHFKFWGFHAAMERTDAELLVELDHDDWFSTGGLDRLHEFASTRSAPGFYYSDFIAKYDDGFCKTYDPGHGWQHYEAKIDGITYRAVRSLGWNPNTLSSIAYMPHHVRAWHREVYRQTGGFDPKLDLCDDYDLLCRTYLTGCPVYHLGEPIYFYREHDRNTYSINAKRIAQIQQQVSNTYFYKLVDAWCRREKLSMLDVFTVHDRDTPRDYEPLSLSQLERAVAENTAGVIRMHDVLHKIPQADVPAAMNMIYDRLAPGGWLLTRTPTTNGRGAFCHPHQRSYWNPNSFWYYTNGDFSVEVPEVRCRFQATRVWECYATPWHEKNKMRQVCADLLAVKSQPVAGLVSI